MNCIICDEKMKYYFSKHFNEFDLGKVDYFKCINCGFVISKSHFEMTSEKWEKLNYNFHIEYNRSDSGPNRPPYFEQAVMYNLLIKNRVISENNILDWGAGEGELSVLLKKYFNISINNYDKYIFNADDSFIPDDESQKYYLVIVNSIFEHLRFRETFEEINNLVDENGALAIHTLVREKIPNDPEWMYLLPVHCSFHTNKSMTMLFNNWGYECSIYSPLAKTWILFKNNCEKIKLAVKEINKEIRTESFYYADKFLDYWH